MSDLYYIAPEERGLLNEGVAVLTGSEAQHLTRVMRKKVGEEADLFDGSGKEYRARIESIARDRVELTVLETREDDREPDLALTAIVALPKGDRQKWAIEKLTELGVRRFIPLDADRADVKFDSSVLERLQRQTLEASKQCGRLKLMDVLPSIKPAELPGLVEILNARIAGKSVDEANCSELASAIAERFDGTGLFDEIEPNAAVLRVVAHPISDGAFGQKSFMQLVRARPQAPDAVLILIGPVGGFADHEVQSAVEQGWEPLDLGKQVYRVETAAIVAAALFLHLN